MTQTPQPGDVWERDGKRREVDRVIGEPKFGYDVYWNGRALPSWCATWMQWQSKATLIERDGKAVPRV